MKQICLHPSGKTVDCEDDATVLSALEGAGYALPNNCRAGACGECKVRVVSGQFDQGFVMDMALSQQERREGYGLMCMAKPVSDVLTIDWGTEDAKPKLFPPREDMYYVVTERIARTPRIVEFRLLPLGQPMRFWPGQYVAIAVPGRNAPPRHYSIASAPRADGEIVLQVTRVEGGAVSTWLHDDVPVGSRLQISGPYGTFIGDPSVDTPVLCLAAGSGLAPILSLTEAALRRGFRRPVHLLFSARTRADLYAEGLLAYWQARHRNFRWQPTLTGERVAGVEHGRIPGLLPRLFPELREFSVFVAGQPAFVDDCVAAVKQLDADEKRIHTEGFHLQQGAA
ncbi:2Fe-2S iron-sulfur cluster-binding protein [Caldimonas tepidiphila]|uniref:2Fe-2S iron-sulfur cluster-binding protein n=1 Tax=Caldimonas tepidiphila TaxID=2315841 RepID=UPI000E5B4A87|nr:2Fe-2S iron-sulfur cluster-binding protein [Caldimonas tepidiphila]